MAAVSSLGIGSGLDLNTLLAGLKSAEQVPLAAIQKQQTSYTTKLTAYGQLNSVLGSLQTAAAALAKSALFQGVKASSTATDIMTATALSTATSATYAVDVKQLSQAQSLAAAGVASDTKYGAAGMNVQFEFGSVSTAVPPVYTADGTARNGSIDIPAGSTIADIAKAINANTTLGATASIINNGDPTKPSQLVLTSKQTGEASIMRITVSGETGTELSDLLMFDPTDVPNQKLQQTAAAQNTKLTLNGIVVTSTTNTVAGAVQDVTMNVSKIGITTMRVQQDTGSVQNAISAFVSAYNSLQGVAAKLTAFDAIRKSGAVLLGDSTLRNIQVGIRSALTAAQTDDGSSLTMLSQVGVSFQKDGTLALDSTKLSVAMDSKMSGVENLFSGGSGGFGIKISALITSYTDTTGGVLTAATKGISTTLDLLGKQYTATSERADATVARYKAQFTALDVMMSRMNQTSTYLKQQFDALNNNK